MVEVNSTFEVSGLNNPRIPSQLPVTVMVCVLVAVNVPLMSTSASDIAPATPPVENVLPSQIRNSEDDDAVRVSVVAFAVKRISGSLLKSYLSKSSIVSGPASSWRVIV